MAAEPIDREIEVRSGLLTAELDFGREAFRGEPRRLEILVRADGDPVTLSPRQAITSAQSRSAE